MLMFALLKLSIQHILKQLEKWGALGEPISQVRFDLPKSYGFHRKTSKDVEVDLWRIDVSANCDNRVPTILE